MPADSRRRHLEALERLASRPGTPAFASYLIPTWYVSSGPLAQTRDSSMYSKDLDPYTDYTPRPFPGVRRIGWLDDPHPFTKGCTPTAIIEKLREIMRGGSEVNVHVNQIRGVHPCNICGERFAASDEIELLVGSTEVWIPDGAGGYFASPSMIIHYITKHKYLPPEEFLKSIEIFDLKRPFNAQTEYLRLASEAMRT